MEMIRQEFKQFKSELKADNKNQVENNKKQFNELREDNEKQFKQLKSELKNDLKETQRHIDFLNERDKDKYFLSKKTEGRKQQNPYSEYKSYGEGFVSAKLAPDHPFSR